MSAAPIIAAALFLQAASAASPRDSAASASGAGWGTATIRHRTSPVAVFADSVLLGTTPIENARIPAGSHVFRYAGVRGSSWFRPSEAETVSVGAGERFERTVDLPALCRVTSEPLDAEVTIGDSSAGRTPLTFVMPRAGTIVTVRKEGYRSFAVPLADSGGTIHAALEPEAVHPPSAGELAGGSPLPKSTAPLYMSAAVTVVAGASAAYFKIRADNTYSDYLNTGDKSLLPQIRSFDRAAGISLAASQIGLGVLTWLLLTR